MSLTNPQKSTALGAKQLKLPSALRYLAKWGLGPAPPPLRALVSLKAQRGENTWANVWHNGVISLLLMVFGFFIGQCFLSSGFTTGDFDHRA